jgi:ubiquinone/menaquinone biosynthesis C-methylase UbiE
MNGPGFNRMNMKMKDQYQKFFSRQNEINTWDSVYDRDDFVGDIYRQRLSKTLAWVDIFARAENSRLLDAGCGAGHLIHEAIKKGYDIIGMDYSYGMLINTKSLVNRNEKNNTKLCQGDVESVPFNDSSFDIVTCLGVIPYLPSEKKVLSEFARVLKPGGILIFSTMNKARLARYMDLPLWSKKLVLKILRSIARWRMSAKINNNSEAKSQFIPSKSHFIPSMCKSLKLAGFTVCKYETIPLDSLTFFGKEISNQKVSKETTLFFEKFSNVPLVGSFGGMCIFTAKKNAV